MVKIKILFRIICYCAVFYSPLFPAIVLADSFSSDRLPLKMWYKQSADEWMKATPIGNGRLGAMIFGGVHNERIALNEITMWAGQPDPNQELSCGKEKLAEVRQLFFEGKLKEGNDLARKYLSGKPNTYGTHLPVGDLNLTFSHGEGEVADYKRELNIETAITKVSYKVENINYQREYFCSNPDNVLIIKMSADKKNSITFDLVLDILSKAQIQISKNQLEFQGKATSTLKVRGFPDFGKGGVDFYGKVYAAISGGSVETGNGKLKIIEADQVILTVDIRTSYLNPKFKELCEKTIGKAIERKYDRIKEAHIQDYNNLFKRVEISLGRSGAENLPTDERLAQYNTGNNDPDLCALFMQYGRYLLISSSRENSPLPANLQGLWNDNLAANMPWTCDYHNDINTQQNYWAANVTNLPECNLPLFNYIADLAISGEKTAPKVYGSPGWVAHTVTNVWGYTSPGEHPSYGFFPTASAWLALHLWDHYNYTRDAKFLREKAYPILKKNSVFFMDYMVMDTKTGYLMTGPSTSPENSFFYNGETMSLSMMPTCDRVFLFELFNSCITASEILKIDESFRNNLKQAVNKLPPIKIGKTGGIQEWFEDYDQAIPNHRHTTHLTSLYPYSQVSLLKTPKLASAAAKTIQDRLGAKAWEDVEWSRANMINFFARLKEPEKAWNSLNILLKNLTRENLLTMSPGGIAGAANDIFVLDGNEATAAGIAEMLIQSHEGFIEFLPCLPVAWQTGSYKGLCVRGGGVVNASWENGGIKQATLLANSGNTYNIKLPNAHKAELILNGKTFKVKSMNGDIAVVVMRKNDLLEITYK